MRKDNVCVNDSGGDKGNDDDRDEDLDDYDLITCIMQVTIM